MYTRVRELRDPQKRRWGIQAAKEKKKKKNNSIGLAFLFFHNLADSPNNQVRRLTHLHTVTISKCSFKDHRWPQVLIKWIILWFENIGCCYALISTKQTKVFFSSNCIFNLISPWDTPPTFTYGIYFWVWSSGMTWSFIAQLLTACLSLASQLWHRVWYGLAVISGKKKTVLWVPAAGREGSSYKSGSCLLTGNKIYCLCQTKGNNIFGPAEALGQFREKIATLCLKNILFANDDYKWLVVQKRELTNIINRRRYAIIYRIRSLMNIQEQEKLQPFPFQPWTQHYISVDQYNNVPCQLVLFFFCPSRVWTLSLLSKPLYLYHGEIMYYFITLSHEVRFHSSFFSGAYSSQ